MIMQWTREGKAAFTAKHRIAGQTVYFILEQDEESRRWRLWADGKRVTHNQGRIKDWYTAGAAMATVDALQERLVLEAAKRVNGTPILSRFDAPLRRTTLFERPENNGKAIPESLCGVFAGRVANA